jgi:hypothetical protein
MSLNMSQESTGELADLFEPSAVYCKVALQGLGRTACLRVMTFPLSCSEQSFFEKLREEYYIRMSTFWSRFWYFVILMRRISIEIANPEAVRHSFRMSSDYANVGR